MCLSILLAQAIGCYLFLMSLAMLIHSQRFKKAANDYLGNPAVMTLVGALTLVIGLLIVLQHNIWVSDWVVLITLVGWIVFLQGVLRLFVPDAFAKMSKDFMSKPVYTLVCWARLIIGIYLIWAGFSQA